MIEAYALDWLNLVLRWAHVITGIAWIGSSFYFIWLDLRLNVPPRDPENPGVAGDLWAVHGGGFYHAQKYRVAPASLPEPLHWFKWEAYFTWITGFLLFTALYYANTGAFLVDPAVRELGAATAIAASLVLLAAGWFAYDALSRSGLAGAPFVLAGLALLLALCFGLTQLFGGRGAFMQAGAMLGTIMAANVWRVIIPSQKALVAASEKGEAPDAALGLAAKQRSVHNNYLTLPVVLAMVSPHFAFLYANPWNWLVLFLLFLAGAFVRHWFNLRNQGRSGIAWPAAALAIGVAVAIALAPSPVSGKASFVEANRVIQARCVACHSAATTHPTAPVAAAGVMLDTPREIGAWAARIHERAVVTRTMPLANLTGITDEERALLGRWYAAGAPLD
ncbi:MAG: urate hydroxylase PuuD [Gammaproteobacteria bacterium]